MRFAMASGVVSFPNSIPTKASGKLGLISCAYQAGMRELLYNNTPRCVLDGKTNKNCIAIIEIKNGFRFWCQRVSDLAEYWCVGSAN